MKELFNNWKSFLFFYRHGYACINVVSDSTDSIDKTTKSASKTTKKAHEVRVDQMQKQGVKAQQSVKVNLYNK